MGDKGMDQLQTEYHKLRFPDIQDDIEVYGRCDGCKDIIYCGEEVIEILGEILVHDDVDCVFKSVGAKRVIAEK
jgi:hypothetical protein